MLDRHREPDRSAEELAAPFDVAGAYDEHGSELFGFALNSLHDRNAAEDCVQEVFLRAWRAHGTFDASRGTVRTWLFAIARNVIVDMRRKSSRTGQLLSYRSGEPDDEIAATVDDPIERMRVQDALSTLTPQHREVVVAIHITGTSYAELAETTGVAVSTLRTRAFYGLRALRQHFDRETREQDRKDDER